MCEHMSTTRSEQMKLTAHAIAVLRQHGLAANAFFSGIGCAIDTFKEPQVLASVIVDILSDAGIEGRVQWDLSTVCFFDPRPCRSGEANSTIEESPF